MENAERYAQEDFLNFQKLSSEEKQAWIENQNRKDDLIQRNVEICPSCQRESSRDIPNCEFCGADKLPF